MEETLACKWCGRPQSECFLHCHKATDGKHVADPFSAQQADQMPFCIDYRCTKCGITGGVRISPGDIYWE